MNGNPIIDVWLCWNDFPFSKSAEEVAWLNFSYVGPEIESGWSLIKRKKRRASQSPGLAWLLIFEACRIRGQCECHICRLNCLTHCASRLWVWHLTSWHSVTMSHIVPPHWSISIPWARAQKQTFIQSCTLLQSHDPVKPKPLWVGLMTWCSPFLWLLDLIVPSLTLRSWQCDSPPDFRIQSDEYPEGCLIYLILAQNQCVRSFNQPGIWANGTVQRSSIRSYLHRTLDCR